MVPSLGCYLCLRTFVTSLSCLYTPSEEGEAPLLFG
jgi:hypothetical protein